MLLTLDPVSQQFIGQAYVSYTVASQAVAAYEALDGKDFMGRLLHVLAGQSKRKPQNSSISTATTFANQRRENNKREAATGKDTGRWNSLYMNIDAVLEAVAAKHKTSKADLLADSTEKSGAAHPAIKQALAESANHLRH